MNELIVEVLGNDETFQSDAVLTGTLEDGPHPHAGIFLQVSIGKDDGRIFPSQFEHYRGEVGGGGHGDLPPHFFRTNEGDVFDIGTGGECLGFFRIADHELIGRFSH